MLRRYSSNRTFYEILQVSHDSDLKEIKSQYYKLCKLAHPDTKMKNTQCQVNFQEITAAYETLKNSKLRREYDRTLALTRWEAPKVDLTDFKFKENRPDYRANEGAMKFWSKMAESSRRFKKDRLEESEITEAMRKRKEERQLFRDRAIVLGAILLSCWVSSFLSQ